MTDILDELLLSSESDSNFDDSRSFLNSLMSSSSLSLVVVFEEKTVVAVVSLSSQEDGISDESQAVPPKLTLVE